MAGLHGDWEAALVARYTAQGMHHTGCLCYPEQGFSMLP
ncbi:hypothetical protein DLM_2193 [Aquitalea magnusonii]|uniref:Uncharacterized protein n=1 Tax=Aquitalea magnusonii TaxID=332411 RepID=A0A3G9GD83_9NEIS|nr:hypothetical protein DLM_2193 [Aquitalea magnusonii]